MNLTQNQIRELKTALKDKQLSPYHKRIHAVYLRSQKMTSKATSDLIGLSHLRKRKSVLRRTWAFPSFHLIPEMNPIEQVWLEIRKRVE